MTEPMKAQLNRIQSFTYALALSTVVGCEGYRDTVHGLGASVGTIQTRDIQQAKMLREVLPGYLGLPSSGIRVEPGSGGASVTVFGVSVAPERKDILTKVDQF